ncbi:MAG TPA: hemerythrin domain-containing protein [Chitinophagaceae bacterium]|jgi:hypothetical protein|nr:hemerythrin domain-containing protein [Chitinophagaceae bacterium]
MQSPKPIRRSHELAPLSREHHEGLLAVWKIRQGLRKGIPADRIFCFVQWFGKEHLEIHMEREETVLAGVLPLEHPMMERLFDEHRAVRRQLEDLREYASPERLEHLAAVLEAHIRFEERYLFPQIESSAGRSQLAEMEAYLSGEKAVPEYEDPFWERKKPAGEGL